MEKSKSLRYEPSSEMLHISAKQFFLFCRVTGQELIFFYLVRKLEHGFQEVFQQELFLLDLAPLDVHHLKCCTINCRFICRLNCRAICRVIKSVLAL